MENLNCKKWLQYVYGKPLSPTVTPYFGSVEEATVHL